LKLAMAAFARSFNSALETSLGRDLFDPREPPTAAPRDVAAPLRAINTRLPAAALQPPLAMGGLVGEALAPRVSLFYFHGC
jgi:hypothetical protein